MTAKDVLNDFNEIPKDLSDFNRDLNFIDRTYSEKVQPDYAEKSQRKFLDTVLADCKTAIDSTETFGKKVNEKVEKEQSVFIPKEPNEQILFELRRSTIARELEAMQPAEIIKEIERSQTIGQRERTALIEAEAPLLVARRNFRTDRGTQSADAKKLLSLIRDSRLKRISEQTRQDLKDLKDFELYSVAAQKIVKMIESREKPLIEIYSLVWMLGKKDLVSPDIRLKVNEMVSEFITNRATVL